jgi:Flp pilus assembly protein TadD
VSIARRCRILGVALAILLSAPLVFAAPKATSTPKPSRPSAAAPSQTDLEPSNLPAEGKNSGSVEAQQLFRRATTAFGKGDLAAAQRGFEKALELSPENPAILVNLGLIAYRRKDYPHAEERLKKVVRQDPENSQAWLILGVVSYDQEKLDAALAALAQAVLLAPKDPRAHLYLGVTVGRKNWYSGAEDEMRRAIELQPNYAEAHFNLAIFYLQRQPPAIELARRHYEKALDLGAPRDPQVEKNLK